MRANIAVKSCLAKRRERSSYNDENKRDAFQRASRLRFGRDGARFVCGKRCARHRVHFARSKRRDLRRQKQGQYCFGVSKSQRHRRQLQGCQCGFFFRFAFKLCVGKKFDLIFLDPPYATNLAELAIELIIQLDLLNEDGIIVFEHGAEKSYEIQDMRFKQRTKKMGTVTAEFISRKKWGL